MVMNTSEEVYIFEQLEPDCEIRVGARGMFRSCEQNSHRMSPKQWEEYWKLCKQIGLHAPEPIEEDWEHEEHPDE